MDARLFENQTRVILPSVRGSAAAGIGWSLYHAVWWLPLSTRTGPPLFASAIALIACPDCAGTVRCCRCSCWSWYSLRTSCVILQATSARQ